MQVAVTQSTTIILHEWLKPQWENIVASSGYTDQIIWNFQHKHQIDPEDLVIFAGADWCRRYAHDGYYADIIKVWLVEGHILGIVPRFDPLGNPTRVRRQTDQKYYWSIYLN